MVFTPFIIVISKYLNLVDYPNDRKIHKEPVPFTGGFLIIISLIYGLLFIPINNLIITIIVFSCLFFLLGIVDDKFDIHPIIKLIFQIAIVTTFLFQKNIQQYWIIFFASDILNFIINLFWILLVINAINLIDGVDGLALTLSIIAFACYIVIESPKDKNIYLFLFVIIGGLIGLLKYNLPEAKIFLGDNGSLTLGFLLSSLGMVISSKTLLTYSIFIPLTAILIPITDVFIVSLKRLKQKKSIFSADKNHIHHELLALGFTKRQVLMILALLTSIFSISNLYYSEIKIFFFFITVILFINFLLIIIQGFNFINCKLKIKKYNRILRIYVRKLISLNYYKKNFTFNILIMFFLFLIFVYTLLKINWNLNFFLQYLIFFIIFIVNNFFDYKDDTTKIFSNFLIFWYYLFTCYEIYNFNKNVYAIFITCFFILNVLKILIEKRFELFLYNPTEIIIIHLLVILMFNHIINFQIILLTFLIYNLGKDFLNKNLEEFKIFYSLFITISIIIPILKISKGI